MNMKKKMGTGILAGALGLSLVAGGTFAAFNDVETTQNTFAAGTLDLETNADALFDLSNLKPGDYTTKTLTLTNKGTLAIDEVLLTSTADGWEDMEYSELPDDGDNNKEQFLSQFEVKVMNGPTLNLADLVGHNSQRISFEGVGVEALQPNETRSFEVKITFKDDNTRYEGSRLFKQNKYQGEGATLNLNFEATQMPGEEK